MNHEEAHRYQLWVSTAAIRPARARQVNAALLRAIRNRPRLLVVASALGYPWQLLAALQELEASGNMSRHPANGDPLTRRTVNHPAGMPRGIDPPFTYENCAREELEEIERPPSGVWTILEMCHAAEHFNGTGYRQRAIPSPYVVASTTLERRGRFVSDHVYDATVWSDQVGALALWIAMGQRGIAVP